MNRIKFKERGRWGLFLLLLCGLSFFPAQAALNLKPVSVINNSSQDISNNVLLGTQDLIDAYFLVPAMPANPTQKSGRLPIAKDKPTYDTEPAIYKGYISGGTSIYFIRDNLIETPSLNDSQVKIRIWSTNPNQLDGYYSLPQSFSNSETGGSDTPFSATTNYKAASPYKPEIYQFVESKTTNQDDAISGTLAVASRQPNPIDGSREITSYTWKIGLINDLNSAVQISSGNNVVGPNNIYVTSPSANLTIDLSQSSIALGTELWFFVEHRNWFTTGNNYSEGKKYAISGSGTGIQSSLLTFESGVANGKFGINFFSMPFPPDAGGKWYVFNNAGTPILFGLPSTNEVSTARHLVEALNAASANNVVSTFGYWNKASDQQNVGGVRITYPEGVLTESLISGGGLSTIKLRSEVGYQVYLNLPAGQKLELLIKNVNQSGL